MSTSVDLDDFVARHGDEWERLRVLATRRRRLDVAEADELVALYRRVSTQLSVVRSRAPDPELISRLSRLLSLARSAAVGAPAVRGWAALAKGVRVDFPVAVYRTWRWSAGAALASLGVSALMWWWLREHPDRIGRLLPDSQVRQLVDRDFANYYRESAAQSFAARVWTNNALVAALCLFLGVTVIGTVIVLWVNTANLGVTGGIMIASGKSGLFFGLITPHGLLELTAVFVAAGVGPRTGWAWLAPGDLPRSRALAEAGRLAAVVAAGLVFVLLVSGVIEAFVTPSGLPTWARIAIGVVAWGGFVSYVAVLGRRAVRAGLTGDTHDAGDVLPV